MPRLPLARTYRPQRFAEMLGQVVPVRALGTAAARGDIASAYIFSGTRGIGKTTIARIFAKALNCEKGPSDDCCDACTACREIAEGRALDVLELDAATHTGIDDIRELREAAQYPPSRDRYRVFVLDEAHQLSGSAWNGLLKILEEPPPWCVFLFCTTEPHKIPQTIESRALHFAFRSPTPAQIRDHLRKVAEREQIPIDTPALELLAEAADGSVRDGLSALDQVRALTAGTITRDSVRDALGLVPGEAVSRFVDALGSGDAAAALEVVATLDDEGQDLRAFTADVLERVRRLALVKVAGTRGVPDGEGLAPAAEGFRTEQLVWLGRVLDETESRLRQGGTQRALLDLAAVRMTRMAGLTDVGELLDRLSTGTVAGSGGGGPAAPRPRTPPAPAGPPPRRFGPDAAPRRAGAAVPEPAPGPAPEPAPDPAPPAAAPDAADLLDRLVDAVHGDAPGVAAYLRNAQSAVAGPDGSLALTLPQAKAAYESRLLSPAARAAICAAGERLTGRPILTLAVSVASNGSAAGNGRPTRREVMDRALKDPLVRSLFDRFGAVVLESQPLDPDTDRR